MKRSGGNQEVVKTLNVIEMYLEISFLDKDRRTCVGVTLMKVTRWKCGVSLRE